MTDKPDVRARNALRRVLDNDVAVARRMDAYFGLFESRAACARAYVEDEVGVPDWLFEFLALDRLVDRWERDGVLMLPDRKTGGVHVFLTAEDV